MSKTKPMVVKIGLLQMACSANADENMRQAVAGIRTAATGGAQIICLQELFRSTYFCQTENTDNFSMAEPIPGPSTETLSVLAKDLGVVIVVPLFEKRAEGIFHNSAAVIDADGTLLGVYRKMHIPHDPCFYEKFYFTPGDTGFKSFQTRFGRVGVLICWDQWFPEAARLSALSGAQILFYPTAIGFQQSDAAEADKQVSAWETVQRGHAIANGVFLAAANRTGREGALQFWGRSFVCDPFGEILAQSGKDPDVLLAVCDLEQVETVRQDWPFLRDRRVDAYRDITNIYNDPDV